MGILLFLSSLAKSIAAEKRLSSKKNGEQQTLFAGNNILTTIQD